jgi:hypothetical protein
MKRFTYSTVGYGVFSLMGEKYRMGRIEVFDSKDDSGYAVHEGIYCMPHEAAAKFEDFIEDLETDLPIHFEIGNHNWCADEYARENGYEDWDDLLAKSKWTKKTENENKDI